MSARASLTAESVIRPRMFLDICWNSVWVIGHSAMEGIGILVLVLEAVCGVLAIVELLIGFGVDRGFDLFDDDDDDDEL